MTEEKILGYLETLILQTDQAWILNSNPDVAEYQTSIGTLIVSINEENVYIEDVEGEENLYDGLIISLANRNNLFHLVQEKENETEHNQILNTIGGKIFDHLESKLLQALDVK